MATLSEMASGIAKKAKSIGMEAATLALRLADAECKQLRPGAELTERQIMDALELLCFTDIPETRADIQRVARVLQYAPTEPGAPLSNADWNSIDQARMTLIGLSVGKGDTAEVRGLCAVLAKRNTAQSIESLADHCAKVAEQVAEMPDWKKGSAVNERPIASTAQADREDQRRGTQPAPVDYDLADRAMSVFLHANHLRPEEEGRNRQAVDAVIRLVQQDSNARFKKALKESEGFLLTDAEISDILARMVAPPTLQERITERFKTQRCINSSVWNPAELAKIAVEEAKKEQNNG